MNGLTRTIVGAASSGLALCACAGHVVHGVRSAATGTMLHSGDRELITMGFLGTSDTFHADNFAQFTDGRMSFLDGSSPVGALGWNDVLPRDLSPAGNRYSGNPDRADGASPFVNEASGGGTLGEVFGATRFGYKNFSYIIDGEGSRDDYRLDLFFGGGRTVSADADPRTVELAVLERGMNSDLNVYGIRADRSTTGPLFLARDAWRSAGWKLDTLEIGEKQKVGGVGVSLDESWTGLIGFRFESGPSFNGPDIVAVGASMAIPAPGAAVLAALGVAPFRRRRR